MNEPQPIKVAALLLYKCPIFGYHTVHSANIKIAINAI